MSTSPILDTDPKKHLGRAIAASHRPVSSRGLAAWERGPTKRCGMRATFVSSTAVGWPKALAWINRAM
jgi:hypothetical protein